MHKKIKEKDYKKIQKFNLKKLKSILRNYVRKFL